MILTHKNKSQDKCLICNQCINNEALLYSNCFNRTFKIELVRKDFAEKNDAKKFLETYDKKYFSAKNLNTQNFWDDKFDSPELIKNQDSMTQEKIDYIISLLPNKKSKILDLGIGQGYLEQRLKQLKINHKISGIDISKTSISRLKKSFDGKYIVGDILKIDKHYKKNYFDVAVAIEVIEHVTPDNIFKLYKKVFDVLKPSGIFIISTPLNEGLDEKGINPSAHVREYNIPTLEMEFKLAKFKILNLKTFYAFPKFYEVKKALAKIFPFYWKPNNIVIKAVKI